MHPSFLCLFLRMFSFLGILFPYPTLHSVQASLVKSEAKGSKDVLLFSRLWFPSLILLFVEFDESLLRRVTTVSVFKGLLLLWRKVLRLWEEDEEAHLRRQTSVEFRCRTHQTPMQKEQQRIQSLALKAVKKIDWEKKSLTTKIESEEPSHSTLVSISSSNGVLTPNVRGITIDWHKGTCSYTREYKEILHVDVTRNEGKCNTFCSSTTNRFNASLLLMHCRLGLSINENTHIKNVLEWCNCSNKTKKKTDKEWSAELHAFEGTFHVACHSILDLILYAMLCRSITSLCHWHRKRHSTASSMETTTECTFGMKPLQMESRPEFEQREEDKVRGLLWPSWVQSFLWSWFTEWWARRIRKRDMKGKWRKSLKKVCLQQQDDDKRNEPDFLLNLVAWLIPVKGIAFCFSRDKKRGESTV